MPGYCGTWLSIYCGNWGPRPSRVPGGKNSNTVCSGVRLRRTRGAVTLASLPGMALPWGPGPGWSSASREAGEREVTPPPPHGGGTRAQRLCRQTDSKVHSAAVWAVGCGQSTPLLWISASSSENGEGEVPPSQGRSNSEEQMSSC